MEISAVARSYARWAPFYDYTFGAITRRGHARAARHINGRGGAVLEVGVGTGLALKDYSPALSVTGIDFSDEMLDKARQRVRDERLAHVKSLRQMDARRLDFADNSFDTVAAMHLMSVVPEPERVMAEMARVAKPGGEVVVVNHFARDTGILAAIERLSAPLENLLGWHSDFERVRVMGVPALSLVKEESFPPLGIMTCMIFRKAA